MTGCLQFKLPSLSPPPFILTDSCFILHSTSQSPWKGLHRDPLGNLHVEHACCPPSQRMPRRYSKTEKVPVSPDKKVPVHPKGILGFREKKRLLRGWPFLFIYFFLELCQRPFLISKRSTSVSKQACLVSTVALCYLILGAVAGILGVLILSVSEAGRIRGLEVWVCVFCRFPPPRPQAPSYRPANPVWGYLWTPPAPSACRYNRGN